MKIGLSLLRESESILIQPVTLQPPGPEPQVNVVRTKCTMQNTGDRGFIPECIDSNYRHRGKSNSPLVIRMSPKSKSAPSNCNRVETGKRERCN